jgi:hypothetical protein
MNKENQVWTMQWTQPYTSWPEPEVKPEPELEDLTLARTVLAKVMAK